MPCRRQDLAYIAGILDGEGFVGLIRQYETRREKTTVYYHPKVCVNMTDPEAIELMSEVFGGTIYNRDFPGQNRKPLSEIVFVGVKKVWPVLGATFPYLRVKKKQAQLIMEFMCLRDKAKQPKWGQSSYTSLEHEIYWAMRRLNKRGV